MTDDDVRYELKTVRVIRGVEAGSIAKWQRSGWELVSQEPGTLRTALSFRRPKSKFPWISVAAAGGVLALVAIAVGVGTAVEGGDDGDVPASTRRVGETTAVASEPPPTSPGPTPSTSDLPDANMELTVANSEELAALLAVGDYCDESIERFANRYTGRTIAFDGSIANMATRADYDTRYDILLGAGDDGAKTGLGPAFRFEDVNVLELNLIGANMPDRVGVGDKFRFIVEVDEFDSDSCIFVVEPVSTEGR